MASRKLRAWRTQKEEWRQLAEIGALYAIVETRGPAGVREKALEVGPSRALSLYQGTYEAQYENSAPFFFHADPAIFEWIAGSFWGTSWGIFIWAHSGFSTVRTHFQSFLRVKGSNQRQYLFRFYDPWILPAFLRGCNDAELAQFFGPAQGFGANHEEHINLLRLAPLPG